MRSWKLPSLLWVVVVFFCLGALAQSADPSQPVTTETKPADPQPNAPTPAPAPSAVTFDQVIDRVVEREHAFNVQMRHLHPLVETYIQNLKTTKDETTVPTKDEYFLGRLDMSNGTDDRSFMGEPGFGRQLMTKLTSLYSLRFLPLGFAQMVVLDDDFQKKFYNFTFVRREFLGEVRCLVIDVQPKDNAGNGRFLGRMWVEDQDYNIVRFNGTYAPHPKYSYYLHFDSWRLNMRPGMWLPAYIYSEESDLQYRLSGALHFKAQTRLWGYDLKGLAKNEEFAQIVVDNPQSVRDQSEAGQDATPVESERMWERQAEDNAVERLQKIGLLAPEGEVDKVLQTVVNNLMVTNNLVIVPDVRTRVLLTSPLESFTIGHTIVMSRGLIDVLPDEASLAMVLAHELSHIALGHKLDTKLAFNDRMFFPDEDTFERLDFQRTAADEAAADKKALELLTNSPYKDKLGNAGLFLKALQARAPELRNLIRPHLGNSMANGKNLRMSALLNNSPQLEARRTDQIAALPLGGRVKVDPWSNRLELVKAKQVPLVSAQEKMPFEVTPFFPFLTRYSTGGSDKVAQTAPVK
ncbi:MAG TPA: M48 family metalloprotease [Terriglobales bacterium]|nr:M48 family metalloprotease [Terriglobales bacterium]